MGESGSGKSTVAKLLAGQERRTHGTIELDGKPIEIRDGRPFRRYKRQVQYVFQDPFASLNPVHTVGYNLSRPVKLHQPEVTDVRKAVMALLEQVSLTPGRPVRREVPARAVRRPAPARLVRPGASRRGPRCCSPTSLCPCSTSPSAWRCSNLLDDLRSRLSLALLYITHDIASARYFADEVLVMYGGQIVERGPAEDVTQRPAHPYTQLLIASAPDPDDLGSVLKSANVGVGGGAGRAGNVGPAPPAARSATGARLPWISASGTTPLSSCCRPTGRRRAGDWT